MISHHFVQHFLDDKSHYKLLKIFPRLVLRIVNEMSKTLKNHPKPFIKVFLFNKK